jgi:hypothetical protein
LMDFGRIIRVTSRDQKTALYVVAEQDAAKAEMLLAANLEPGSDLEHVGHASLKLLAAMFLSPGQFKRTDE